MLKSHPKVSKLRTGVLSLPSNTGSLGNRISEKPSSVPLVGTWITHNEQKNVMEVSSVLKKATCSPKVDNFIIGTNPSSDLNTPEIRFDDFAFQSKIVKHEDSINMDEVLFHEVEQSDINDCSTSEDCLTAVAPGSIDKYSLLDMSPGIRDIFQADQLEERMDLNDFISEGENSLTEGLICPEPVMYSQPQFLANHFGNGLGATNEVKNAIAPYSSPPQLSISDEDFNFAIPPEILEQMQSLLPDHLPEEPILLNDEAQTATDLDMYLGTQQVDILTGAIEESGILSSDLEQLQFQASSNDLSVIDATSSNLPDGIQTQWDSQEEQTSAFITGPSQSITNSNFFSNSEVSKRNVPVEEPSTSLQTLISCAGIVEEPKPTVTSKRQRRSTKKPLRFRDSCSSKDVNIEESDEDDLPKKRIRKSENDGNNQDTIFLKEEELEVFNIASCSKSNAEHSIKNLTEEEKYHRIRILNNEASKRCRQKRKANVKQQEKDLVALEEKNEKLRRKHDALLQLKNKLQPFVYRVIREGLIAKNSSMN